MNYMIEAIKNAIDDYTSQERTIEIINNKGIDHILDIFDFQNKKIAPIIAIIENINIKSNLYS